MLRNLNIISPVNIIRARPAKMVAINRSVYTNCSQWRLFGTVASSFPSSARFGKTGVSLVHDKKTQWQLSYLRSRDLNTAELEPDRSAFSRSR